MVQGLIFLALFPNLENLGPYTVKYFGSCDERHIHWTQSDLSNTDFWEVELSRLEITEVVTEIVTAPEWFVTVPGTGMYTVRVRACNSEGCSTWVDSTDAGWVLYAYVCPSTGFE